MHLQRSARAGLGAVVLLAAVAVGPVAAAQPDREFAGGSSSSDFAAGEVCPFEVRLDVTLNQDYAITFAPAADGSQRVIVTGRLSITATNVDSNASVSFNASGPGTLVFVADGSINFDIRGRNAFYLFGTDVDGPGLWLTHGLIRETLDPDGNVSAVTTPPNSVDLCAALA